MRLLAADSAEDSDNSNGHGQLSEGAEALDAFPLIHYRNYNNKRAKPSLGIFSVPNVFKLGRQLLEPVEFSLEFS